MRVEPLRERLPEILRPLYEDECLAYRLGEEDTGDPKIDRGKINKRFSSILRNFSRKLPETDERVSRALEQDYIMAPFPETLNEIIHPYDMIGIVIRKGDENILIVEDNSIERPKNVGAGKTAVLYNLMGISMDYSQFPDVPESEEERDRAVASLEKGGLYRINPEKEGLIEIVEIDMPYIGIDKEGRLSVAPTSGLPALMAWDAARHISRVKQGIVQTKETAETVPDSISRPYQMALAENIYFNPEIFADNTCTYNIDKMIVLNRLSSSGKFPDENLAGATNIVEVNLGKIDFDKKDLKDMFYSNPTYHPSKNWSINKDEHYRRVDSLVEGLKSVPETWKLDVYSRSEGDLQPAVIESLAEIVAII